MRLLNNITQNTTSPSQENYSYLQTVYAYGTFDGASITLQGSPDNSEWFDLAQFSTKQVVGIGLSVRHLRAKVTNAGATTSVTLLVE